MFLILHTKTDGTVSHSYIVDILIWIILKRKLYCIEATTACKLKLSALAARRMKLSTGSCFSTRSGLYTTLTGAWTGVGLRPPEPYDPN